MYNHRRPAFGEAIADPEAGIAPFSFVFGSFQPRHSRARRLQ
jgi:hypothetical protein